MPGTCKMRLQAARSGTEGKSHSEGLNPSLVRGEGDGAVQKGTSGHRGLEISGTEVGNTKCLRPATGGILVCVHNAPVNWKVDSVMAQETQIWKDPRFALMTG